MLVDAEDPDLLLTDLVSDEMITEGETDVEMVEAVAAWDIPAGFLSKTCRMKLNGKLSRMCLEKRVSSVSSVVFVVRVSGCGHRRQHC
jgi:hypothetical protein